MENSELHFFYPYQILYEFVKKGTNHIMNGSQKELMACIIGYKDGNQLIGTEIVFPEQSCPHNNITDLGKEYLGMFTWHISKIIYIYICSIERYYNFF